MVLTAQDPLRIRSSRLVPGLHSLYDCRSVNRLLTSYENFVLSGAPHKCHHTSYGYQYLTNQLGLYTYQLSQRDPSTWTTIDRAISALTLALYWASSAWYFRNGDKPTGTLTAVVGGLQCLTLAQY